MMDALPEKAKEELSLVRNSGPGIHSSSWRPDHDRRRTISDEALLYGSLNTGYNDEAMLTMRLYRFNTVPLSSYWSTILADHRSLFDWLGLTAKEQWVIDMKKEYVPYGDGSTAAFWSRWKHRTINELDSLRYKIYISPLPHHLPEVFGAVVRIFTCMAVPAFKIGLGSGGILRPDKFVAYFRSEDDRVRVARELSKALRQAAAQGVPFSQVFNGEDILSFGEDPPAHVYAEEPSALSWRLYVCARLARSFARARTDDVHERIWSALAALKHDGVDTEKWCMRKPW